MTVPAELKRLPQWVCWKLEERAGKPTKVPYRADGAGLAAVNSPETWSTARAAYNAWLADGFNGIGLVLTGQDPYCGIDLDNCVIGGDQVADWAQAIVDRFASYTELTPSGSGLRIWIRGQLPGTRRRTGSIELYDRERYFTLTGKSLPGTPAEIADRQAELEAFYRELFPPPTPATGPTSAAPRLTDLEVLQAATAADNGAKATALLRGDKGGYTSGSEADLGLLSILAFYTQDPGQLERLWRGSGLWREKAEREDYRRRTIEKALEGLTETYSGGSAGEIRHTGNRLPAEIPAVASEAGQEAEEEQPWLTPLGEYLTGPPEVLDWLVDGLLIKGGVAVVGAKPKVAKTTLLTQFALAVARGAKFLGRPTVAGPVIYLALEEDRGRVVDRFRRLGALPTDEVHLHVGQAGPDGFARLAQAIRDTGAVMAIVDPIQRLTRLENINDYSEVSNATDPLIAVARETGCAVVFSHHLGKIDRGSGDQLLGSTALFGSVDTSVIIRKREEDKARTLETIQRYGTSLEPVVLGFNEETGAAWVDGPAEEYELERDQVLVLKTLSAQFEPTTQSDLIDTVAIGWTRVRRAVDQLVAKHHVEKRGAGRRSDPFLYRALIRPEDMPVAFANSRPVSSQLEKETENETEKETQLGVFKKEPHGFLSPLTGVERGNLHPSPSDPPESSRVIPLRPAAGSPPTCPNCAGENVRPSPAGTGMWTCLTCRQGFDPAGVVG